jgi:hypothetical protein
MALISFLAIIFTDSEASSFWSRMTGQYKFAYWFMFISNSVLPLCLIFKKCQKLYILLLITILMNLGWLFESFVIHVTSLSRDYSGGSYFPYNREIVIVVEGICWGVLAIIIGNLPGLLNKTFCEIQTSEFQKHND